ncbi:unnamed protein product [Soboliphyme baturini]|uniref:U4/U6 small nuclear ribonucleoprotein Prp31 n=1 Tax=Soboliphyme baturini TaxID=241478 RepID=A0A183J0K7_9BILA|nr:unnamed protein product [Soboliphyme baturini]
MSLADELLADLEEDVEHFSTAHEQYMDDIEDVGDVGGGQSYDRITAVARLFQSEQFKEVMKFVEDGITKPCEQKMCGPVESNPEYRLIVEANNLAVEVDNEIDVIHKFVRDKYSKRFPELESLVPMPIEYITCVKELGNDILEKAKNSEHMQKILMPATVIVVSVTASTTQGEPLTSEELSVLMEACDMALDLNAAKIKIYEFVETRMHFIAPNLSAIVGAATAAKLMGVAGGLTQLSKMPACNILVLGSQKRALTGFSSTAILPHTGFIYYTPMVQELPIDLRRKATRLIAAKCTLAARVDSVHASSDAEIGRKLLDEIEMKIDKWQEPPPPKPVRALPKPLDQASKKRGGRRVRKMKERLGLTELRRKANRMNFGELEEDVLQDDLGFSLGQMKTGGPGGRLRTPQVDQKSRVRLTKALHKNLQKQSYGGTTSIKKNISGTVSTVTFTPVQGLEIVNPQAVESDRKVAEANAKYFGAVTKFVKVHTPVPKITPDTKTKEETIQ